MIVARQVTRHTPVLTDPVVVKDEVDKGAMVAVVEAAEAQEAVAEEANASVMTVKNMGTSRLIVGLWKKVQIKDPATARKMVMASKEMQVLMTMSC